MPRSLQKLESEIAALSPSDRDLLLRDLIAGLHDSAEEDVESAWSREIQRRYRQLQEGVVTPVAVEDVIAQARRALQR